MDMDFVMLENNKPGDYASIIGAKPSSSEMAMQYMHTVQHRSEGSALKVVIRRSFPSLPQLYQCWGWALEGVWWIRGDGLSGRWN